MPSTEGDPPVAEGAQRQSEPPKEAVYCVRCQMYVPADREPHVSPQHRDPHYADLVVKSRADALERELVEVRRERDELRMLLEGSQIDATEQAQRAERAESRLRAVTRDTYR